MEEDNGVYQFTVTLGENLWEEFFLVQDGNRKKMIFPAQAKSWKSLPTVGPFHDNKGKHWRIDGRNNREDVPEEDVGKPGDLYMVTFSWRQGEMKNLEWDKLEGEVGGDFPSGKYYVYGTWTCWDMLEMTNESDGVWSTELKVTWLGAEFRLARNQDLGQMPRPEVLLDEETGLPTGTGSSGDPVVGPDSADKDFRWKIDATPGDTYKITFTRNPKDFEDLDLTWDKISSGPAVEPEPRYFMVLEETGWGTGGFIELKAMGKLFAGEHKLKNATTNFVIL